MTPYLLKLDDRLFADWKKQAAAEGLSIAEMIRYRVSWSGWAKVGKDAKHSAHDTRGTAGAGTPRRRAGVAAKRVRLLKVPDHLGSGREQVTVPAGAHDPTCQCRVCQFKREVLGKAKTK